MNNNDTLDSMREHVISHIKQNNDWTIAFYHMVRAWNFGHRVNVQLKGQKNSRRK